MNAEDLTVQTPLDQFGAEMNALVAIARESRRIVALTGAGISTESGIPDYRGPAGVWETGKPPTISDFLDNEETRRDYWARRVERYPVLLQAQPNPAHRALAELERTGHLQMIVTQNIDGLHQAAGSDPDRVVELHGTAHRVHCVSCHNSWSGQEIQRRQLNGEVIPGCTVCGGLLRTATVLFGEAIPRDALERSLGAAKTCDLLLIVGSSLVVNPAAKLPLLATRNGSRVAIVNKTATQLDRLADVRIEGAAGEILPRFARQLLAGQ